LTFIYFTHTPKHMARKEVRQETPSQTTPISKVSENETAIEVRTAGR
jgi:hypothetical protein